jgi:L-threonylcarbamoyladenylate synthase
MSALAAAVRAWRFGDDPALVARALDRGAIVAIPTESSYGLAVDPRDAAAVARVYELKGRGSERALPVVVADLGAAVALGADAEDPALAWAAARWPAALSVVVRLRQPIPAAASDGTLAVRVPAHAPLRALLAALGRPLTATSANPTGEPPYLDPEPLAAWLASRGADALVVDAGRLAGGEPSTLVAWRNGEPVVLRPGRVPIA